MTKFCFAKALIYCVINYNSTLGNEPDLVSCKVIEVTLNQDDRCTLITGTGG